MSGLLTPYAATGRLLLALGGVDAAITLLAAPPGGSDFVRRCRLTGHLDWIRSLAFAHTSPADTSAAGAARGGACSGWVYERAHRLARGCVTGAGSDLC